MIQKTFKMHKEHQKHIIKMYIGKYAYNFYIAEQQQKLRKFIGDIRLAKGWLIREMKKMNAEK